MAATARTVRAGGGTLARSVITLASKAITLNAADTYYRVTVDWSNVGLFADRCLVVTPRSDNRSAVIDVNLNNVTRGSAELLIMVPAGYGSLALNITVEIAGVGWSGLDVTNIVGVWGTVGEV